jgi:hypothetical protein
LLLYVERGLAPLSGGTMATIERPFGKRKNDKTFKKAKGSEPWRKTSEDGDALSLRAAVGAKKDFMLAPPSKQGHSLLSDAAVSPLNAAEEVTRRNDKVKRSKNKFKALAGVEPLNSAAGLSKGQPQDARELHWSGEKGKADGALKRSIQNSSPTSRLETQRTMGASCGSGEPDIRKTGNSPLFRSNSAARPAANLLMEIAKRDPEEYGAGCPPGVALKQKRKFRAEEFSPDLEVDVNKARVAEGKHASSGGRKTNFVAKNSFLQGAWHQGVARSGRVVSVLEHIEVDTRENHMFRAGGKRKADHMEQGGSNPDRGTLEIPVPAAGELHPFLVCRIQGKLVY